MKSVITRTELIEKAQAVHEFLDLIESNKRIVEGDISPFQTQYGIGYAEALHDIRSVIDNNQGCTTKDVYRWSKTMKPL